MRTKPIPPRSGTISSKGSRNLEPLPNDSPELNVSSRQTTMIANSQSRSISPSFQVTLQREQKPRDAKTSTPPQSNANSQKSPLKPNFAGLSTSGDGWIAC